ncbi:MAG: hypothetical protein IJ944_02070 [Clostridia bacterium]|nr:hypothetical protein [Clostridia bacterium]
MENNVKTLEQIQEEFMKRRDEFTENKSSETVLEKIRIDEIVEDLIEESVEESLDENLITEEEQTLKAPQIFLEEEDAFEQEDIQFPEMTTPYVRKKGATVVRVITTIVIILCVVGILLGAVMFVVGKDAEKEFFGYGFYPEYTEKMSPKYNRGDMVLYEAKGVEEIVAETTVGSYIVAYTNMERKELCVAQVEDLIRDDKTGDISYKIRADKTILEEDNIIQAHLVKGKAKFYPLKWSAFGTYYVIKYVKYFAIGFFASFVVAIVVRAIFGRKIKSQYDEDADEKDIQLEE